MGSGRLRLRDDNAAATRRHQVSLRRRPVLPARYRRQSRFIPSILAPPPLQSRRAAQLLRHTGAQFRRGEHIAPPLETIIMQGQIQNDFHHPNDQSRKPVHLPRLPRIPRGLNPLRQAVRAPIQPGRRHDTFLRNNMRARFHRVTMRRDLGAWIRFLRRGARGRFVPKRT